MGRLIHKQLEAKLFPPGSDAANKLLRSLQDRGEEEMGKERYADAGYKPFANFLDRFAHGLMPLHGTIIRSAPEDEVREVARAGYESLLGDLYRDREAWRQKLGDLAPEARDQVVAALAIHEDVMETVGMIADGRPWEEIIARPSVGVLPVDGIARDPEGHRK